ncbi:MAG: triose-phosphate isomerase [Bacteroidales bacterium]|jgi:triosephosphate isomerase|nr:triose-phosphate isomerase [Bacteroidales bacterium]
MRRKIVAGNWKMNKNFAEAEELLNELYDALESKTPSNVDVVVCPPSPYLEMSVDFSETGLIAVGAQDVSKHENGAYTGEISAQMLASMQVEYCIVGHSERRKYHNETDADIAQKTDILLKHEITPIVCCGEVLDERESNKHFDIVKKQIADSLFHLDPLDFAKVIIAYEPVWAIGTGHTATPEQAQEMHAFIRKTVEEKYGKEIAKKLPILYGGSCNAKNVHDLFTQPDVDGGLIGGASLVAQDFVTIANAF